MRHYCILLINHYIYTYVKLSKNNFKKLILIIIIINWVSLSSRYIFPTMNRRTLIMLFALFSPMSLLDGLLAFYLECNEIFGCCEPSEIRK